jgi:hypothetical protein
VSPDIFTYRRHIEAALKYADDSHSFEDIVAGVEAGQLQFWPGPNSVIITEILTYPNYRALNFFLAGGDIRELETMYTPIEGWAQERGCDRAVLTGRKGWERTFLTAKQGWQPKLTVYEKKFHHGEGPQADNHKLTRSADDPDAGLGLRSSEESRSRLHDGRA